GHEERERAMPAHALLREREVEVDVAAARGRLIRRGERAEVGDEPSYGVARAHRVAHADGLRDFVERRLVRHGLLRDEQRELAPIDVGELAPERGPRDGELDDETNALARGAPHEPVV